MALYETPTAKAGLTAWYESGSAGGPNTFTATAGQIGIYYNLAFGNAAPVMIMGGLVGGPITTAGRAAIVAAGFEASMLLCFAMPIGTPTALQWMPAAMGVLGFWTGMQMKFTPPAVPPGAVSGVNNSVIFPGSPMPLASQIAVAMSDLNNDASGSVDQLFDAFEQHLYLVSGMFNGISAAGTPYPFPWIGLW